MPSADSDPRDVLLRAAYDLLAQQYNSGYVLNLLETTARWDDAECDGYCLMDEIATLLEIEE